MAKSTAQKASPRPRQGPEEKVRQDVIAELRRLGWPEDRLRWSPEWTIPDTPHDLTKRDRGQRYAICGSSDLVAFADASQEPHALQVIFEFKAPTIEAGKTQLLRYLSNEPMAKLGFWTNGTKTLAIYKRHAADWLEIENAALPQPGDDLTQPPDTPPTWARLRVPSEVELAGALRRLVATVVVSDSRATRREDQLRELVHLLLVKLASDSVASRSGNVDQPVAFRIYGDATTKVALTSQAIRDQFRDYFADQRTRVFHPDDRDELLLTDETIYRVVAELAGFRMLGDDIEVIAKAFQVIRAQALKSEEGQFLTPARVIRPCVMALDVTSEDKIIDPACGTGSFLVEALRQVRAREFPGADETHQVVKWANEKLYGIDIDQIGTKLTRASMIALQDGSTHVLLGDAIRKHLWSGRFPRLADELGLRDGEIARQFTVVITNPPFGKDLKISASDARAAGYSISQAAAGGSGYADLEIGLMYLELAFQLLRVGGRVGIILPETYFFSHTYRWLPEWLNGRLVLRGMVNIPMEAFEEFCRAKTNFYIFEKVAESPEPGSEAGVTSA